MLARAGRRGRSIGHAHLSLTTTARQADVTSLISSAPAFYVKRVIGVLAYASGVRANAYVRGLRYVRGMNRLRLLLFALKVLAPAFPALVSLVGGCAGEDPRATPPVTSLFR
jgi:hypothetical protein